MNFVLLSDKSSVPLGGINGLPHIIRKGGLLGFSECPWSFKQILRAKQARSEPCPQPAQCPLNALMYTQNSIYSNYKFPSSQVKLSKTVLPSAARFIFRT